MCGNTRIYNVRNKDIFKVDIVPIKEIWGNIYDGFLLYDIDLLMHHFDKDTTL